MSCGLSREQFNSIEVTSSPSRATLDIEPSLLAPTFGELVTEAFAAIDLVEDAADAYGHAVKHEMRLEDDRQALKPLVTHRIATTYGKAPSAAEKLVEADEEYMQHRRRQYDAVIEKERHRGEYDAAKLRARLSVALVEAHTTTRGS